MSTNVLKPQVFTSDTQLPEGTVRVDVFDSCVKEFFFIQNPGLKKEMPGVTAKLNEYIAHHGIQSIWIYFPWLHTVIRTVPEDVYFQLRTARNRNIISSEKQHAYRNFKVGIAGLSVGSAVLNALVVSGGPKMIKIADFDDIELTNLNRIRAGAPDLGKDKTEVAARYVWELDPFADLELWKEGLTRANIENFIADPRLNVFIDEMDSIDLKIFARFVCKKHGIPVLMATDNGDGAIIDVERYDLNPELPIFHGLVGDIKPEDVPENLARVDFPRWIELATKIVGPDYLTESMQESLTMIGKEISAVPQLGTSAQMAGSSISFIVRRLAAGEEVASGRYVVSLEEKLIPNYMTQQHIDARKEKTRHFKESFGKR